MPSRLSSPLVRDAPVLRVADSVEAGVRRLLDAGLPALPVVGDDGAFAGVFGEREFLAALFPGYLGQLQSAGFVPRSLEDTLQKRSACRHERVGEHLLTDHVEVATDFSDAQVAETFLHHRVLIVPVVDGGAVVGVITRGDFFSALAERFLAR